MAIMAAKCGNEKISMKKWRRNENVKMAKIIIERHQWQSKERSE
jgi:hypothetical protein